jgi:hypothetical protein
MRYLVHDTDGPIAPSCSPERFVELEATVERGLEAYIETGQVLAEIRDTRAYVMARYASFKVAYLEGRWHMSRRHAFDVLAAITAAVELVQTCSAPVWAPRRDASSALLN